VYQIVYVSSAMDELGADEVSELLLQCRQNNARLGVTGILIYQAGRFLQVLEGDEAVVNQLVTKIRDDDRHSGFFRLLSREIPERQFGDWSMAYKQLDDADAAVVEGLRPILDSSADLVAEGADQRLIGLLNFFEESLKVGEA
jgi:hypothetical protein